MPISDKPASDNSAKIIPFGKYKGRLLEELLIDDPSYLQWLGEQAWFRARFAVLYQVIINRGAEPEETPDHNAMQVRFLNDEFCLQFVRRYRPDVDRIAHAQLQEILNGFARDTQTKLEQKRCDARMQQGWIESGEKRNREYPSRPPELTDKYRADLRATEAEIVQIEAELTQQRRAQIGKISFQFNRTFEVRGVDVSLQISAASIPHKIKTPLWINSLTRGGGNTIAIEIKPTVGDDYPAVLRQMRANDSGVLFVGEYRGQGATQDQFIKTMATADICVVFARDVEAAP